MTLFNHAAIWPGQAESKWPKAYFCNGHVLVNAEKMSKNLGNFLTLDDAITEYTADATRIGLADAGDSLDDANFQKETASSALMRLYVLKCFVDEMLAAAKDGKLRTGERTWTDISFENRVASLADQAKDCYQKMLIRDALKYSFFDFLTARDQYRILCGSEPLHQQSIMLWIETLAVILSPIAPHICEYIWSIELKKPTLVVRSPWPKLPPIDRIVLLELEYLENSIEDFRQSLETTIATKKKFAAKHKKDSTTVVPTGPPSSAKIYVARDYPEWQQKVLTILKAVPLDDTGRAPTPEGAASYVTLVKDHPDVKSLDKKLMKEVLGFASFRMKTELPLRGAAAFELTVPFDELRVLESNKQFIETALGVKSVEVELFSEVAVAAGGVAPAVPSRPSIAYSWE